MHMNQTDWIVIATIVSAASTVVLTIITGFYVYLTHRLVRVQEQPLAGIRLEAQESVARSLANTLNSKRHLVGALRKRFPLDLTKEPSASDFESLELETLIFELGSVTFQLSKPLVPLCHKAYMDVKAVVLSLLALEILTRTEQGKAFADNRTWSWDEARKTYLTTIRQTLSTKPAWEDIVAGKAVSDAVQSLDALHFGVVTYLQMPVTLLKGKV